MGRFIICYFSTILNFQSTAMFKSGFKDLVVFLIKALLVRAKEGKNLFWGPQLRRARENQIYQILGSVLKLLGEYE